MSIKRHS